MSEPGGDYTLLTRERVQGSRIGEFREFERAREFLEANAALGAGHWESAVASGRTLWQTVRVLLGLGPRAMIVDRAADRVWTWEED